MCRTWDVGLRGSWVQSSDFRLKVQGLGLKAWDMEFRVWGVELSYHTMDVE